MKTILRLGLKRMLSLAAVAAISSVMVIYGYHHRHASSLSADWKPAKGIIEQSKVSKERHLLGKSGSYTSYRPAIRYRYTTPTGSYSGNHIIFHASPDKSGNYGKRYVQKFIDNHPPGKEVTVYYNPQDHTDACLEPGRTRTGGFLVFVGVLGFLSIPLYLAFDWLDRYAGIGRYGNK